MIIFISSDGNNDGDSSNDYYIFRKTESLDNATLARAPISLAIMTYMRHHIYHALYICR